MAAVDCVTSAGVRSAAASTFGCVTRSEPVSAASRVAWAGSTARRQAVDWLPRPDMAWFDPQTGRPTPVFARFMREMAETRMGGPQGRTVPQVAASVTSTQAQVQAAVSYVQQVGQYAQGIAATVAATVQVTQDEALPGSDSIPTLPTPPGFEP